MEYYILINGEKKGPFSLEELMLNNITEKTKVWRIGLPDWQEAKDIQELSDRLHNMPPKVSQREEENNSTINETGRTKGIMPKTWLVESVLATIFCCIPFGIVGMINASRVETFYLMGEYEQAKRYSKKAKTWTFIALAIPLILLLGIFLFWAFIAFAYLLAKI